MTVSPPASWPPQTPRRRSTTRIVVVTVLVTLVVVVGAAALAIWGLAELLRGPSPAADARLVAAMPTPAGGVLIEHSATTGFDSGPSADRTYWVEDTDDIGAVCADVHQGLVGPRWRLGPSLGGPAHPCAVRDEGIGPHASFSVQPAHATGEVFVVVTPHPGWRGVDVSYST